MAVSYLCYASPVLFSPILLSILHTLWRRPFPLHDQMDTENLLFMFYLGLGWGKKHKKVDGVERRSHYDDKTLIQVRGREPRGEGKEERAQHPTRERVVKLESKTVRGWDIQRNSTSALELGAGSRIRGTFCYVSFAHGSRCPWGRILCKVHSGSKKKKKNKKQERAKDHIDKKLGHFPSNPCAPTPHTLTRAHSAVGQRPRNREHRTIPIQGAKMEREGHRDATGTKEHKRKREEVRGDWKYCLLKC